MILREEAQLLFMGWFSFSCFSLMQFMPRGNCIFVLKRNRFTLKVFCRRLFLETDHPVIGGLGGL